MKHFAKLAVAFAAFTLFAVLPMQAAENQFAVGGGYVNNAYDPDEGSSETGNGLFGVFRIIWPNGLLFNAALSASEFDYTDLGLSCEDNFSRLGLSVGYMFRKDEVVSPFLHGGLAWVQVESEVEGIEYIDDSSMAFTAGVGLEVGKGRHAFYSSLSFDSGHEVDGEILGIPLGTVEYDLRELHLGYIYRFDVGQASPTP